ncbi:MAG: hypothetical protein L3J89_09795 [Gammaproteobacteria bacterium]|nr:hypothetical protein [Gammaproteobacteria bacterium]
MAPLTLSGRLSALPMTLLALMVLVLPGCFHNDDDPVPVPVPIPNADPVGYYDDDGYADVMLAGDEAPSATIEDLQGMVYNGQLMMFSESANLTYVGTFTVSGNDISGSVTVYEADEMTQENVPFTGLITQGANISGTLAGTGVANGTFKLEYAADNGPVNMEMLVSAWEPVTSPPVISFVRVNDNALPDPNFNSATSGTGLFSNCGFNGRIKPLVGIHLYSVTVTVDSCSPGTIDVQTVPLYTGLVSVRSDVDPVRMTVILTNGAYDFSGEYRAL